MFLLPALYYIDIMRIIFLFVVNVCCSIAFSQPSEVNAVVEYTMVNNTDSPNVLKATLSISGTTSIYLPHYSLQKYNDNKFESKRVNRITEDIEYLKVDDKRKEILFYDYLGNNIVIVKDDYNELKWNITEETKLIGNHKCIKATVVYRGRKWVAWFAPDITLPYGPWKMHGLPGIIMELYDETERYMWSISKIEYIKSNVFDKEFDSLIKIKNKKPISKKEFIENETELNENIEAEMKQLMPDMGTTINIRTGYELKYEWEE